MAEALDHLEADGNHVNALRVRAFPFAQSVEDFIHEHDRVFVVEQNRDGQLRSMLMNEFTLDARKLVPVLHYDGTPITARFIAADIAQQARPVQGGLVREGRVMTYIAKPKLHHPSLVKNKAGFTRRDYEGAVSTLCAGCGHDSISAAIIQACYELDILPHQVAKLVGHRLLVQGADLLRGREPRLQHRARPHAVGDDRRQPRQPRPDLHGRVGRRRFGLDRARTVRPHHAARRQHDLHRHEQRRVRPHQGPVLGHRRQGLDQQEGRRPTPTNRSTSSRSPS